MGKIILKPGREKPFLRRHPWLFSGAIAEIEGSPAAGETVEIWSATGNFLARAAYSPHSQIRARVWTWDQDETIDRDFFRSRLAAALNAREQLYSPQISNAFRLVHAESDGLPGFVVDQYAGILVVQCLTMGAEIWLGTLIELLQDLTGIRQIYERSDVDVRRLEGLPLRVGPLVGEPPPDRLEIIENGLGFWVDIQHGHKTGFYLDQRPNRAKLQNLAKGRTVLNCFAYTGGFAVCALAGGATRVISIDESDAALALGHANVGLNGFSEQDATWLREDVFKALRSYRDQRRTFDLIVLDPPKFAPTRAHVPRATRGYKDINLLAFKLLSPGGILLTFSCSGGLDAAMFQKVVADAALDAGVQAQILEILGPGRDHPVALNFPEGAYLKGLICRVV